MKEKILNKILYYSKKERDARMFKQYNVRSKILKEYTNEELMAVYFETKEREEYRKNIINLFFVSVILLIVANVALLYSKSFATVTTILVNLSSSNGMNELEALKIIIMLLIVTLVTIIAIIVMVVHSNIKSLAETRKQILQLEFEIKRRRISD